MPHWGRPYRTRRSFNILSYAVNQNKSLLETGGVPCVLIKRKRRADATFQLEARKVDYQEKTIYQNSLDPDTGMYKVVLWTESNDSQETYPDIGTLTCTVQASGSSVWESAVDKYSFIADREEYAYDIHSGEVDALGNDIEDSVHMVFNTPPFNSTNVARLIYGTINPLTSFEYMQPSRDNHPNFQHSLFAFDQWMNTDARIRRKRAPHQFLVAFPGTLTDITMTEGGFLRQSKTDYWCLPPGQNSLYAPEVVEHDIIVKVDTGQRYMVTSYTPIYVESVLVSQHFSLCELAPKSSLYTVPILAE